MAPAAERLTPWETIYRWFAARCDDGRLERTNHALVRADRERVGRDASPSAGGSQIVVSLFKTASRPKRDQRRIFFKAACATWPMGCFSRRCGVVQIRACAMQIPLSIASGRQTACQPFDLLPDYTRLLKRHRDAAGKVICDCPRLPHTSRKADQTLHAPQPLSRLDRRRAVPGIV